MGIQLEGSCRCGGVRFSAESHTPYPYQRCYCTICRKTAGGGGYALNLMAAGASLTVRGRTSLGIYRATLEADGRYRDGARHLPYSTRCTQPPWFQSTLVGQR